MWLVSFLKKHHIPRRYWSDLKRKLEAEGSEVYEKIVQLKMRASDGKMRLTDVANPLTPYKFQLVEKSAGCFCKYLLYLRTPPALWAKYNFEGTDIASNPTSKLRSH